MHTSGPDAALRWHFSGSQRVDGIPMRLVPASAIFAKYAA